MPTCPACQTEQARRVNGTCPACHVPVEIHQGRWFLTGTGSPSEAILKHFEALTSQKLKAPFSVARKSARYKRELVAANRLLDQADFDLPLVKDTLDILFSHKMFIWKNYTTLMWLDPDYTAALAIAKKNRRAKQDESQRERDALRRTSQKENIFTGL